MGYALKQLRVLVVDENKHILQLMRTILESVGTGVVQLSVDADEAFQFYCRDKYDVVFTDSEVKPISGLGFVDLLRTSPNSPNPYVPVVMCSADFDQESIKLARDHGVTEFLAKPFSAETVLSRLEAVLEKPRTFVRTNSYFGPDRRRKQNLNFEGDERRKTKLEAKVELKKEAARRKKAALSENVEAIDELAKD